MLYIILFIGTVLASAVACCLLGLPLVVLRAHGVLTLDDRLWWSLGCFTAVFAMRAGVLAMNDLSVPTDPLSLGAFKFQMFGSFVGVFVAWLIGMAVLSVIQARFSSEVPDRSSTVSWVAILIMTCAAGYLFAWPSFTKRRYDDLRTRFIAAVKTQDTGAVRRMISSGYRPEYRYSELDSSSPVGFAIRVDNKSLVAALLIDQPSKVASRFIGAAIESGNRGIVDLILDHGNRSSDVLCVGLKNAVLIGDREHFDYFLTKGADPNYQYSHTVLMHAAGNNRLEFARELIAAGADVNTLSFAPSDYTGCTALIWAAKNGHRDIVELLLEHDADVNLHHPKQASALISAARNGDLAMVELLMSNGANANDRQRGKTVLQWLNDKQEPNLEMIQFIEESTHASDRR